VDHRGICRLRELRSNYKRQQKRLQNIWEMHGLKIAATQWKCKAN